MSFSGRTAEFDAQEIPNDDFYVTFKVGDFNASARIDTSINIDLVILALRTAVAETNADLVAQKRQWEALDFSSLEQIPNGIPLYLRTVFCRAKATLLKEYATLTRKKEAENTSRESDETEGFYIQEAEKALRLLCGDSSSHVCKLL